MKGLYHLDFFFFFLISSVNSCWLIFYLGPHIEHFSYLLRNDDKRKALLVSWQGNLSDVCSENLSLESNVDSASQSVLCGSGDKESPAMQGT